MKSSVIKWKPFRPDIVYLRFQFTHLFTGLHASIKQQQVKMAKCICNSVNIYTIFILKSSQPETRSPIIFYLAQHVRTNLTLKLNNFFYIRLTIKAKLTMLTTSIYFLLKHEGGDFEHNLYSKRYIMQRQRAGLHQSWEGSKIFQPKM